MNRQYANFPKTGVDGEQLCNEMYTELSHRLVHNKVLQVAPGQINMNTPTQTYSFNHGHGQNIRNYTMTVSNTGVESTEEHRQGCCGPQFREKRNALWESTDIVEEETSCCACLKTEFVGVKNRKQGGTMQNVQSNSSAIQANGTQEEQSAQLYNHIAQKLSEKAGRHFPSSMNKVYDFGAGNVLRLKEFLIEVSHLRCSLYARSRFF
jgi:hypothetical protein